MAEVTHYASLVPRLSPWGRGRGELPPKERGLVLTVCAWLPLNLMSLPSRTDLCKTAIPSSYSFLTSSFGLDSGQWRGT